MERDYFKEPFTEEEVRDIAAVAGIGRYSPGAVPV